jgi:negative regulator of flagellin synthesis FlgM
MPDPIRGVNPIEVSGVASANGPGSQPAPGAADQAGAAVPIDSADLSRAQALTTISEISAAVPSIDRTRVAELQQAINSGTYQANPQLIAEKIMEIESLLSARGGG